jgi:hypothetical protein
MLRVHRTYLALFLMILLAAGIMVSCKKEKTTSQGTNFNLLLKLVSQDGGTNRKIVYDYSYGPGNVLAKMVTTYYNYPSSPDQFTQYFYRGTGGRLDSLLSLGTTHGQLTYTGRAFYFYGANGLLTMSKAITPPTLVAGYSDSSIYQYNGTVLQKRTDYRSFGGPYSLLCEAEYQYTAASNPVQVVFKWVNPTPTDTLRFQYDNNPNPIPAGSITNFYWAPVFYNYSQPANNLLSISGTPENDIRYTEYRLTNNQKPLYRKALLVGSPNFVEYYYYYD